MCTSDNHANSECLDVIYGTLLGDGCIMRDRKSYRLDMSHGVKQLDYLYWKMKLLGCTKAPSRYVTGYGSEAYRIRYYNKPLLEYVYKTCRKDGQKQVTEEWLSHCTTRSLAIWYQDDGSWGAAGRKALNGDRFQRQVTFSTCDFDENSHRLLCEWLRNLGYSANIKHHKDRPYIVMYDKAVREMWSDIAPFIVIRSKLDWGVRPSYFHCDCGRWSYSKYKLRKCDKCVFDMAVRGEAGKDLIYTRFKTTSIARLKKIGCPEYEEPMIRWFRNPSSNEMPH